MSFDSHNLERLRKLGRNLKKSPTSTDTSLQENPDLSSNLHPIETEQDPKELFRELIKASPDGEIPSHLIDRLKKIESVHVKNESHSSKSTIKNNSPKVRSNTVNKTKKNSLSQESDLYISFKQLLLEED